MHLRSTHKRRPDYGMLVVLLVWLLVTIALVLMVTLGSHGSQPAHYPERQRFGELSRS